jgi:hypothetical protein
MSKSTRRLVLCALLLLALGLRLDGIESPPLDFHPTRQYHSALIAHAYRVDLSDTSKAHERLIARRNADEAGTVEPPLLELVSAIGWHAAGAEHLWMPRVISSWSWLAGGGLLYLLSRRLFSDAGGVISLAVFLFLPFGLFAGRSFQPDPLMVALMVAALLAVVRHHERPTWPRLGVAATLAGSASFVKPGVALFIVAPVYLALSVSRRGWCRALGDSQASVFGLLALGPTLMWLAYGTVVESFVLRHAPGRIAPRLLLEPDFWSGWLWMATRVLGYVPLLGPPIGLAVLLLSLFGLARMPPGTGRTIVVSLWAGYAVFGLTFTEHIHTHDYYSLPLIPVVALSLAPLGAALSRIAAAIQSRGPATTFGVLVVSILVAASAAWGAHGFLADPEYVRAARGMEMVGHAARHSAAAVILAENYGNPLKYHGEVAGRYWPSEADITDEEEHGLGRIAATDRFRTTDQRYYPALGSAPWHPQVFIVADLAELERQDDLRRHLLNCFPMSERGPGFVVYDLASARPKPACQVGS